MLTYGEHPGPIIRIGLTYIHQGEYQRAIKCYHRAFYAENNSASLYACATWHGLANVRMELKQYDLAQNGFLKTLIIGRQIGSLESQAAAWRGLAMIDFRQGKHKASQKKFLKAQRIAHVYNPDVEDTSVLHNLAAIESLQKKHNVALSKFLMALKIEQQKNGRHAEAMTFLQLGMLAIQRYHIEDGLSFSVLSAVILKPIDHADFHREAKPVMNDLVRLLNCTPARFKVILREVQGSYQRDRGWSLIEAAFADLPPDLDKV